jgi:hypothetical protein
MTRQEDPVSVEVRVPAHFVSSGWGTPTVCVKHGEAAVERKNVRFISPPPGWSYVLVLAGVVVAVIVMLAIRKTVEAKDWPFCEHCRQDRRKGLIIGLGIVAAGVAGLVPAFSIPGDGGALLTLLCVLVLVAGYILSIRGGSRVLLGGGRVIDGGQTVQFRKAHEAFAAQATAAQQSAAQHHAAQQAAALQAGPPQAYPL